jgi:hypothetical protein
MSNYTNYKRTNSTVQPKAEYFTTATAHTGVVTHTKFVYGMPTKRSKKAVHRIWVRITTTEGWTLMGYIGSADKVDELPAVKKGDIIVTEPFILSVWKRVAGRDERSKDYDRALRGKIVRGTAAATAVAAAAPVPAAPVVAVKNAEDYSDFAMPPVFALIDPEGDTAFVFVPNPWHPKYVMVREMNREHNDGIWRWSRGNTLDKQDAVDEWKRLVSEGWTSRDVIAEPMNGDGDRPDWDRFASYFSMATNRFANLVASYHGEYPRKTNA